MGNRIVLVGLAAVALLGCHRVVDEGSVVVTEVAPDFSVAVNLNECLTASSDKNRSGECSLVREGNQITLESTFEWTSEASLTQTADCGILTARCSLDEPLAPGSYVFIYGDETTPFVVDENGIDTRCFGDFEDHLNGCD